MRPVRKIVKELEDRNCFSLAKELERIDADSRRNSLKRFAGEEYKDYKYGDPSGAASRLQKVIETVRKEIKIAGRMAGPFLAPAILDSFRTELMQMLSRELNR